MGSENQETALRLNEERDKVLAEKIQYEGEREALEVQRREVEMQRSILQSEFIRGQELEHELEHRERMLKMLNHNKEIELTDILLPTFNSCAAHKIDPR